MILLLEANPVTFLEKLGYGGRMLVIGMGTVFSVLALLWGCLELMHFIIDKITARKAKDKQESKAIPSEPIPSSQPITEASNDDEVIAAICAAISAAESEQPHLQFRAVSFKRIH